MFEFLTRWFGGGAPVPVPVPVSLPPSGLSRLAEGIKAAAPGADVYAWLGPLTAALRSSNATTPQRIAAFLGNCAVEAGPAFAEVSENLFYTTPARISSVWPSRFASPDAAMPYLRAPEKLANRVYSGKLGNGDEASGDGWRFRGGGLLQLTGREEYAAYGKARGMSADSAADYVRTPAGACDAAAWYWQTRGCNQLADAWKLSQITQTINGAAMLGNAERIAASNAALKAMQA
jgi:putative chitinase